jgi:hypothetical protein
MSTAPVGASLRHPDVNPSRESLRHLCEFAESLAEALDRYDRELAGRPGTAIETQPGLFALDRLLTAWINCQRYLKDATYDLWHSDQVRGWDARTVDNVQELADTADDCLPGFPFDELAFLAETDDPEVVIRYPAGKKKWRQLEWTFGGGSYIDDAREAAAGDWAQRPILELASDFRWPIFPRNETTRSRTARGKSPAAADPNAGTEAASSIEFLTSLISSEIDSLDWPADPLAEAHRIQSLTGLLLVNEEDWPWLLKEWNNWEAIAADDAAVTFADHCRRVYPGRVRDQAAVRDEAREELLRLANKIDVECSKLQGKKQREVLYVLASQAALAIRAATIAGAFHSLDGPARSLCAFPLITEPPEDAYYLRFLEITQRVLLQLGVKDAGGPVMVYPHSNEEPRGELQLHLKYSAPMRALAALIQAAVDDIQEETWPADMSPSAISELQGFVSARAISNFTGIKLDTVKGRLKRFCENNRHAIAPLSDRKPREGKSLYSWEAVRQKFPERAASSERIGEKKSTHNSP